MSGHPNLQDLPGLVVHHEEHVQRPEEHRPHPEEVARPDVLGMACQEPPPGGRWDAVIGPAHVLGDGPGRHRESQPRELCLDTPLSPQAILDGHAPDQGPQGPRQGRPTAPPSLPGPPPPIGRPSPAMPAEHGVRLDDEQEVAPCEEPIDRRESRTGGRRRGTSGVASGVAARATAGAGTDSPTIKSALGVNHAAIALPAHLITLTSLPSFPCRKGFTRPGEKERRWIEFLRPTGSRPQAHRAQRGTGPPPRAPPVILPPATRHGPRPLPALRGRATLWPPRNPLAGSSRGPGELREVPENMLLRRL